MVSVPLSIVSADSIVSKQVSVRLEDDLYDKVKSGQYNLTDLINSLLREFFDHTVIVKEEVPQKYSIIDEIKNILISSGINQAMWLKQGRQFNDSQVKLISVRLKERGHLISDKRIIEALDDIWK